MSVHGSGGVPGPEHQGFERLLSNLNTRAAPFEFEHEGEGGGGGGVGGLNRVYLEAESRVFVW